MPAIIGTTRDEAAGAFITRSFPSGPSAAAYASWAQTEFGADAPAVLAVYPADAFASPFEAMARLVTDAQFACESRRLTRYFSDEHVPAYLFSYEYVIDAVFPGKAIHGVESNIIFGNDYVPPQFPTHPLDAADTALHHFIAGYWSRFAATGNPNTEEDAVVHWPVLKAPSVLAVAPTDT